MMRTLNDTTQASRFLPQYLAVSPNVLEVKYKLQQLSMHLPIVLIHAVSQQVMLSPKRFLTLSSQLFGLLKYRYLLLKHPHMVFVESFLGLVAIQ